MKPASFKYLAPDSLAEALALRAEHGDDAKALAGGQSLIPAMNFRVAQPSLLVDLNKINELRYIRREGNELRIGAMTTQSAVERNDLVAKHQPLLFETVPFVAHPQIRNRGTLGGSLAHADPAAEMPVVALALDAKFKAQSKDGERWIPAKEFFQGFFTVDLQPTEYLTEIAYPDLPARTGWCFMEVARRHGDYAMCGIAALVTLDAKGICEKARLVYLNVGDGPVDASRTAALLTGQAITDEAMRAAADKAAGDEMNPFGSVHASPEYQKHLARVLTRRALKTAHERALTAH
ncbi:MAG: xanthine dehydrogenase family protein subunit M [Anaerolineae bacterium]|nr:MAG: xanthine dehydrogenase family protein subunit M [Anaerolineae bacterium]